MPNPNTCWCLLYHFNLFHICRMLARFPCWEQRGMCKHPANVEFCNAESFSLHSVKCSCNLLSELLLLQHPTAGAPPPTHSTHNNTNTHIHVRTHSRIHSLTHQLTRSHHHPTPTLAPCNSACTQDATTDALLLFDHLHCNVTHIWQMSNPGGLLAPGVAFAYMRCL